MKRSIIRLFTAVFALLSSLVELAVKLVQLVIALVERLTPTRRIVVVPPQAPSRTPVAPTVNDDVEGKLVGALTGPSLGFSVRSARVFAATVRARIKTEPMDVLVREGIMQLSAGH